MGDTSEQEARCSDVEGPASSKKKSPTGRDTGASLDCAVEATVQGAGSAFSGSAAIVEGTEGQEVHVVIPLAGSSVTAAADLELDVVSALEVRISGPEGLSVSVTLPVQVAPSS